MRSYYASRKLGVHRLGIRHSRGIEAEFYPALAAFERRYGGSVTHTTMRFGSSSTFAVCRTSWWGDKEIIVNRELWNHFARRPDADAFREILIFHELGHCALGRLEHQDERLEVRIQIQGRSQIVNAPSSIMASYLNLEDLAFILSEKEAYYRELFDHVAVTAALAMK